MKFTREIVIDLPRGRVIEVFLDRDNMAKWQEGLLSFEHVSGEPGQPGAKSRLVYEHRGQDVEMIETVTSRNLPDELTGTYESEGVWNLIENRFVDEGPDRTRWIADTEYRFSDWKMLLMSIVLRPMFTGQTVKVLRDFKTFAESEGPGE